MKKIIMTIFVLLFLVGCSSQTTKDIKQTTSKTQQNETKEEILEETKEETKQETKQETNTTSKNKQPVEKKEAPKSNPEVKEDTPNTSQTPTPPTPPVEPPKEVKKQVTISIDCKTILNNMDTLKEQYKNFIPSNGIILANVKVEVLEGDTVLTVLKKITKEKGIRIINQGGYISNIANINQMGMQNGQGGWMYQVNGTLGEVGSDSYKLSNGDVVRWRYTCYPGDI